MSDRKADAKRLVERAAGISDEETSDLLDFVDSSMSPDEWLESLARIGQRRSRLANAVNQVSSAMGLPRGAKPRLLRFLLQRRGRVVDKAELAAVSGINEWPRRIRELRVEDGWPIHSNVSDRTLRPGTYRLDATEPDKAIAKRWRLFNAIRREKTSGRDRLLKAFKATVGQPLDKEELRYVARIQEHPRRIRELVESGWQIESNLDRPEFAPGQYVMISSDQLPPRARQAVKLRFEILERDSFACVVCGTKAGQGRRLQVHHRKPVADGGDNDPSNLETLCDSCHGGKHAMSITDIKDELIDPGSERPVIN